MAELSYSTIAKKAGAFPPDPLPTIVLLVGSDDGLKREAVGRITQAALDPAFADFDQETVDLSLGSASEDTSDPVGRILEASAAAPFSSPKRLVTVLSAQKLSKERQDALTGFLGRLSTSSVVILIADASEMEAGKPKGKQIENSLRKAIAKAGLVLVCDSADAGDIKSRAVAMIRDSGKTFAPGVIEALIAASTAPGQPGADLIALKHETDKLIAYVGDQPNITKQDASAVVPGGTDENIFRLLDCIGARDIPKALIELDELLLAEGKPDATSARLIVMLQRHFRLLALAKHLAEVKLLGKTPLPDSLKELLPPEMASFAASQGYRLSIFAKQASNFRWDELQNGFSRILAADLAMKGIVPSKHTLKRSVDFGDDAGAGIRMLVFDLCYRGK